MSTEAAKFQVSDLRAGFGSNEVLRDISMDVPAMGVTAIIGPSGCGKSTFIRCLNRMHERVPSGVPRVSRKSRSRTSGTNAERPIFGF